MRRSSLARQAEAAGATGILMLPAAYGSAPDDGMLAYYGGIARSVDIGVLPYARDWAVFSPDLLARLAEVPNVVAYKDGSVDLRSWARLRARVGDRLVWVGGVGDDMVHTYFAAGAEGFTSSVANFMPEVALELFEAANGGRLRPGPPHLRGEDRRLLLPAGEEAGLRGGQLQGGDGALRAARRLGAPPALPDERGRGGVRRRHRGLASACVQRTPA